MSGLAPSGGHVFIRPPLTHPPSLPPTRAGALLLGQGPKNWSLLSLCASKRLSKCLYSMDSFITLRNFPLVFSSAFWAGPLREAQVGTALQPSSSHPVEEVEGILDGSPPAFSQGRWCGFYHCPNWVGFRGGPSLEELVRGGLSKGVGCRDEMRAN